MRLGTWRRNVTSSNAISSRDDEEALYFLKQGQWDEKLRRDAELKHRVKLLETDENKGWAVVYELFPPRGRRVCVPSIFSQTGWWLGRRVREARVHINQSTASQTRVPQNIMYCSCSKASNMRQHEVSSPTVCEKFYNLTSKFCTKLTMQSSAKSTIYKTKIDNCFHDICFLSYSSIPLAWNNHAGSETIW